MVDFLIIGGGIIGLNIAIEIKKLKPNATVMVLEKEPEVGMHSSGRNSGVLHAGFYYTADSLKAKFTREGNAQMREFCYSRGLNINECGKVVVASSEKELNALEELKRRGDTNGVDLQWRSEKNIEKEYPNIKTYKKALYSPSTATVDPREVTKEFAKYAEELGVLVRYNAKYLGRADNESISINDDIIKYKKLINSAGLYADKIANDFGFSKNYTIIPFKGIYLKDSRNLSSLVTNVYPVPNLSNPFLGVHYTLTVDKEAKIGPTAIPAFWRENYRGFDNFSFKEFMQIIYYESKLFMGNSFGFRLLAIEEIKKYRESYLLNLAKKLTRNMDHSGYDRWSTPGIRAQLLDKRTLELVQDFIVEGDEKSVHILNAVSPAFTSSIPFAKWIVKKML